MTGAGAVPDLFFTLHYGEDTPGAFTDPDWTAELVARAERSLVQLLARLGVPATPSLTLEQRPGLPDVHGPGWRLYLEDSALPLPDADARRLQRLYPPADSMEASAAGAVAGMMADSTAFAAALVARAAEANAAQLVGDRQNLRWIEAALALRPDAEPIARYAECTRAVLRALLAQGIAITDVDSICRYLIEGLASRRRTAAIAESLIARLQPATLDIELNAPCAARLFPALVHGPLLAAELPDAERGIFDMLRDGLFYELGVRIPPIRLVPADELPPGAFRLRSGAIGWTPWPGLDGGQVLVSLPPARLAQYGITATPIDFPPNDAAASAIPAGDALQAEALGARQWDAVGYIGLAVARDIRDRAGVLLDIDAVESALAQLEAAFPELVYAALEKVSATDLTRVLRKLLAGDVSIRNFRSILERLLAYDWVSIDLMREIVFDPRLAVDCRLDPLHEADLVDRYVEYVRAGLRTWLSHRSRNASGQLTVTLLDHDTIEQPILDELAYRQAAGLGQPLGGDRLEAIREAVRQAAAERPDVALLTNPPVASFLRDELSGVAPRLAVLAYPELARDVAIQPVGRLSV